MRGYKIFGPDYTCRDYKYSLDCKNTYTGKIKVCVSGFHFCQTAVECLQYYEYIPENTYAEVESGNEYIVEDDKVVCKELSIIRTLTYKEFGQLLTCNLDTPYKKCSYVGGVLHGNYKTMYSNGDIYETAEYSNGKLHGVYRRWYESGTLETERNYCNGTLHGKYTEYNIEGKLFRECNYIDGYIGPM